MKRAKDVGEYIADAPKEMRGKLLELRKIIKAEAPEAVEKISYGMPYYSYKGRLVYFACFKKHLSLFVLPPIIQEYNSELKNYQTTKSSIHFPLDQELPVSLIKKLVRARVKHNNRAERKK